MERIAAIALSLALLAGTLYWSFLMLTLGGLG
jgi:hypothetical protein